ncbi:MAG: biopolymer transporter ExbD [Deltaproteobacteria bacterium]|nr:biopolymer transporter ExbD [Deltaproteobacteria bacterium]
MGAKVGGKKGGAMADINVTPLVDVVLVLLIIFMVVTPMLSSGIDVKLPRAKTAVEEKDMGQNLVVGVKGDGRVYVDKTEVTKETLVAELVKVRASRALVLKGDKTATYRQVREVMDIIHKDVPGTDTMLLATEKIKEEGAE